MHAQARMTGELDWAVANQVWRASPASRIVKIAAFACLLALPELILWLIMYVAGVPFAGWIALACALVPWAWLAWRAWTQSVRLTSDFVVLGYIIAKSRHIPLGRVTAVAFRRGMLTITAYGEHHGGRYNEHHKVIGLPLGASYWSGRRCGVDDAADAIAAAAGLAALPQRKQIISLGTSLASIPLILAIIALGRTMEASHRTQLSGEIGAGLLGMSPGLLWLAIAISCDHIRGIMTR
jgi:hypothetical protein